MLVTHDGGLTWSAADLPHPVRDARPQALKRIDAFRVFLPIWQNNDLGSALLESADGGKTWTVNPSTSFLGAGKYILTIVFASPEHGYVFYEDRPAHRQFIAATSDGGRTWQSKPFPRRIASCGTFEQTLLCSSGLDLLKIR